MSNPTTFVNNYTAQVAKLVEVLEDLRVQNSRMEEDPTLVTEYFAQKPEIRRTDIVAQDITNAEAATVQLLFAYDSGTPAQKSELFKVMP